MLWKLIYSLRDYFSPFNVVHYVTFRVTYALLTALVFCLLVGPWAIERLKRFKLGQVVRDYVEEHRAKAGTPTMGGLFIIASILFALLIWGDLSNPYVAVSIFSLVSFGALGFWDDYLKVKRKNPDGIGAKKKFLGQLVLASIVAVALVLVMGDKATRIQMPFFKRLTPDLGFFYIPFAVFVIVATSNAVNLTDGLDGLAIVPVSMCAGAYALIAYLSGHVKFAHYLHIFYLPGVGEVAVVAAAVVGAGLGFLWFNAHPAEVFMGDTGSLSLGALLGTIALATKHELLLPIFGGVFVIETLSVIIQVAYFKATGGKRFFKMAPFHHHVEKQGVPEPKIIVRFWIVSLIFVLIGLSTLKVR